MDEKTAYLLLNKAKQQITKQQYKQFKGQIANGQIEGAMKGLIRILKKGFSNTDDPPYVRLKNFSK